MGHTQIISTIFSISHKIAFILRILCGVPSYNIISKNDFLHWFPSKLIFFWSVEEEMRCHTVNLFSGNPVSISAFLYASISAWSFLVVSVFRRIIHGFTTRIMIFIWRNQLSHETRFSSPVFNVTFSVKVKQCRRKKEVKSMGGILFLENIYN